MISWPIELVLNELESLPSSLHLVWVVEYSQSSSTSTIVGHSLRKNSHQSRLPRVDIPNDCNLTVLEVVVPLLFSWHWFVPLHVLLDKRIYK